MTSEAKRPAYPAREISDEALAWIVRLNSGEAGAADRDAFSAWRRRSAEHEAAATEAELLWSDAADLHRDPDSGLIRPGRRRRGPSRRAVIGGMAAVAAVGASGLVAGRNRAGWLADHTTGKGETRLFELSDGSRVTLNAMSALDVDFSTRNRSVDLLRGQAFFEVMDDPGRPFVVAVGDSRVTALGTAFDIDMNLPGGQVAVTVTEHSVRAEALSSVVVTEGQRLLIGADGGFAPLVAEEASVATAWRSGLYVAEERRLDEVVAAVAPYHDGWIVLRGEGVRALRVNAVLDLRAADAAIDALARGLPIDVRRVSRFLTVISAI